MTVAELGDRMDHPEYVAWQALDSIRVDERKAAERQAKKGMRAR